MRRIHPTIQYSTVNPTYPMLLDVRTRQVLIVGGGTVAARKAAGLLAAGAQNVTAVAPKFVREFPPEVRKIVGAFELSHLNGADLVFAATDSAQVNDQVVAEAHKLGKLVQRADGDEEEPGDFSTPAILRCGPIMVAVSAAGSPALAAVLRDSLAGSVSDEWVNLAQAMQEIRPKIKSMNLPIARRREVFRSLASNEASQILAKDGMPGLWNWIQSKIDSPQKGPG